MKRYLIIKIFAIVAIILCSCDDTSSPSKPHQLNGEWICNYFQINNDGSEDIIEKAITHLITVSGKTITIKKVSSWEDVILVSYNFSYEGESFEFLFKDGINNFQASGIMKSNDEFNMLFVYEKSGEKRRFQGFRK